MEEIQKIVFFYDKRSMPFYQKISLLPIPDSYIKYIRADHPKILPFLQQEKIIKKIPCLCIITSTEKLLFYGGDINVKLTEITSLFSESLKFEHGGDAPGQSSANEIPSNTGMPTPVNMEQKPVDPIVPTYSTGDITNKTHAQIIQEAEEQRRRFE